MQVSVRLSAALAQITGLPRVQVTVSEPATVANVIHALLEQYPALAPRLKLSLIHISEPTRPY